MGSSEWAQEINNNKAESALTSIGNVEFDAEVAVGPAGVVAGGQDDAPDGFDLADDAGHGRGGQDLVLPDHQAPDLRVGQQSKPL